MAETSSWYQTFRKRVAPLAFLIALVALTTRTCSSEIAEVEITLDMGAAAADVRSLRLDIFPRGSDIGVIQFQRTYPASGVSQAPTLRAQLDAGDYELVFDVALVDASKRFQRVITVGDRATITVPLERDLTPDRP